MNDRNDRFTGQPEDIKDEGFLGKDGKMYKELPEDQRMDLSKLYSDQDEADADLDK